MWRREYAGTLSCLRAEPEPSAAAMQTPASTMRPLPPDALAKPRWPTPSSPINVETGIHTTSHFTLRNTDATMRTSPPRNGHRGPFLVPAVTGYETDRFLPRQY